MLSDQIPQRLQTRFNMRHSLTWMCLVGLCVVQVGTNSLISEISKAKSKDSRKLPTSPSQRIPHLRGGVAESGLGGNSLVQPSKDDAVVSRWKYSSKLGRWSPVTKKALQGDWRIKLGSNLVNTVPEAIEDVLEGKAKRVFVGNGKHEWTGARLVVGGWRAHPMHPHEGDQERNTTGKIQQLKTKVELVGEGEARMWGMWFMEPESTGSFSSVTAAMESLNQATWSTVEVWGSPWTFADCDLRSQGGIALKTAKRGRVSCKKCVIGGLGGGEKDELGDWVGTPDFVSGHEKRANFGVFAFDASHVTLERCTIEFTGLVGAALKVVDRAAAEAASSAFSGNSVAVHADDAASVLVERCRLVDNDMGAFLAGPCAEHTSMRLLNNSVHGKLWFDAARPQALLQEEHDSEAGAAPTFRNESFSDAVQRMVEEAADGLDLKHRTAAEAAAELDGPVSELPLGAFAPMYAMARASCNEFDPEQHDLGTWPVFSDDDGAQAQHATPQPEDFGTDEGLERLRHQLWRAAGFPSGMASAPPDSEDEDDDSQNPLKFLPEPEFQ